MATVQTNPRRRLRLAVAGAIVLTALTAATAAAGRPTTMGEQADASPRSLTPGFLLDRGRYTTLEVPGATVETAAVGINNRGQIVGAARGGGVPDRGFLRDARGRYSTFRFPGARSTLAQKLNDRGQLTGGYSTTTDDPGTGRTWPGSCGMSAAATPASRFPARAPPPRSGSTTTARWSASTRTPTAPTTAMCGSGAASPRSTLPAPPRPRCSTSTNAASSSAPMPTAVMRTGTSAGWCWTGAACGPSSPPGALITVPATSTTAARSSAPRHRSRHRVGRGFLLARGVDGPFTPVSVPGAPSTVAFGLNERGQITGAYNNPNPAPSPPSATAPPTARMG